MCLQIKYRLSLQTRKTKNLLVIVMKLVLSQVSLFANCEMLFYTGILAFEKILSP